MSDNINPSHYKDGWSGGAEVIDITENLNFNRGNAIKYIARAGAKDPAKEIEDLQKAQWYLSREITRLAGHHATEDPEVIDAEVVPRVWDSLIDVPADTIVKCRGGDDDDYIYKTPTGRGWFMDTPDKADVRGWSVGTSEDEYGPFTEVLEGTV